MTLPTEKRRHPVGYYSLSVPIQRRNTTCRVCGGIFWDIDSVLCTNDGYIHEWCHPDYDETKAGESFRCKIF
jgi:hypothetical protein